MIQSTTKPAIDQQHTDAPPYADSCPDALVDSGRCLPPRAPADLAETGLDPTLLSDLAIKSGSRVSQFTTTWAADQLCLPLQLVEHLLWRLKEEQLVEILAQIGPFNYRYALTRRGREHAAQLLEICGYVGPAPVSLDAYVAWLNWQTARRSPPTLEQVRAALSALVLPVNTVTVSALAAASGRSLFLFGPPGNGKTSLGRLLHESMPGDLWIPYCVTAGNAIIRMFDPQCHETLEPPASASPPGDQRWIRIRRPLIVVGGEMSAVDLDLNYSPTLRFYEAPPHVKANGGTFLIDDFGRQRIDPHALLNRWIIPLEQRVDYLTLATGQRVSMPFQLMLVVATNLKVTDVADPAFLRRMGYRLQLDCPDGERYAEIFRRAAQQQGTTASTQLVADVIRRYAIERRELRASEPGALIARARDICQLQQIPFRLSPEILNLAWAGYFGDPVNSLTAFA
jgi:predicted ATPase with chaperone activity